MKNLSSTECQLLEVFWNFWPAFQRWAESIALEDGLTPQRIRIIAYLQEHGPVIMSDLKKVLGVTATNVTALVDALEKDGLVTRKPHPKDRRATVIEITKKARSEQLGGCSGYRDRVAELFSSMSETDQAELLRMMRVLKLKLE